MSRRRAERVSSLPKKTIPRERRGRDDGKPVSRSSVRSFWSRLTLYEVDEGSMVSRMIGAYWSFGVGFVLLAVLSLVLVGGVNLLGWLIFER